MTAKVLLGALLLVALAPGAEAALVKYHLGLTNITMSPNVSPFPDRHLQGVGLPGSVALLDDATSPGHPVLRRFHFVVDITGTTLVPGLSVNIFTSAAFREGPGNSPFVPKPDTFTGTGSTAGGSTLLWGIVTGWTVTGSFFCHSSPPVICPLVEGRDNTTVDAIFTSDFYDFGTWTFHSTGFTSTPFVIQYFTVSAGNRMFHYRGFRVIDALVPALPLAGVALLGASLAAGAAVALRRRGG